MNKGFADQPIGGGLGQLLESKNSQNTDMSASSIGFSPAPLFANANGDIFSPIQGKVFSPTDDENVFSNADGDNLLGTGIGLDDVGDAAKLLLAAYQAKQQEVAAAAARGDAIALERLKLQEAQLLIDLEKAKAANPNNKKTSYTVSILVTGGVIILGMAAYFIFRQVKVK